MRTVRRLAVLLGTLVAGIALILLGAPGASAGGPTSVLLASNGSAHATAFYGLEPGYQELQRLLDVNHDLQQGEKAPSMELLMDGQMVTVTWMIHDVTPWRVDQVYVLPPKGGTGEHTVWVHTRGGMNGTGVELGSQGTWHQARTPDAVNAFMADLGLLSDPPQSGGAGVGSGTSEDAATTAGSGADETTGTDEAAGSAGTTGEQNGQGTAGAGTSVSTGWWWALPGIAAGAALGLGVRPMVRQLPALTARLRESRSAAREEGARGELIDR